MLYEIFAMITISNIILWIIKQLIGFVIKQYLRALCYRTTPKGLRKAQKDIRELSDDNKRKIAHLVLEHNNYLSWNVSEFYSIRKFITDVDFDDHDLQNVKLKDEYAHCILASVGKCCLDNFISQKQAKEYLWDYRFFYSPIRRKWCNLSCLYYSIRNQIIVVSNINNAWRDLLRPS